VKRKWWLFVVAPPAIVAFAALGGWIVMLLWNWLLPGIFRLPPIGFWQALGLLALSRILFGGFGRGGHGGRASERWSRMTPEERERFRETMRERCSRYRRPGAAEGPVEG
jgi:hypothetical protein